MAKIPWDKKVRTNEANDVVFPCAMAVVLKSVSEFDAMASTVNVAMTIILRVKIEQYCEEADVVDFLKEKLRCRINEVEVSVVDKEEENSLKAKVVETKSSAA